MSEKNVEIVRNAFAAFERGNTEDILQLCAEDIVITQPPELPDAPPEQHGHRGVLEAFAIWPEQWDDYQHEILKVAAAPGGKVFVATRTRGRGKQSGVEVDMKISFAFTVRDSMITELRIFMREAEALEAAGLSN